MNNRIILKAILTILTLVLSHNICEAQTKRTIHVATAGTLPELISEDEKYQIEELTLTGELNGTDLMFIREMAGSSVWTDSNCDIYLNADGERAMIDASPIGKLTTLDISGSNLIAGGDSYYGKSEDGTITLSCYLKNDNELPPYVFYRSRLSSIILPNSLISIDDGALSYCIGLISITIPQNVTRIGGGIDNNQNSYYHMYRGESGVFYGCNGLQEIYTKITNPFHISENTFPGGIFSNAELIVPKGTKAAYQSTEGWSNFSNIVEDGGAEQEVVQTKRTIHVATAGTLRDIIPIGEKHQIEKLTLTDELNGTDFNYIREMTGDSIHFVTDNDSIHYTTNGKLRKLDISETRIVEGGDPCSFVYSPADYEILHFPTSNNVINHNHFRGFNLEEIILPNNVTSIGGNAFYGCSGLTSITIPNSVTHIYDDAFEGCTGLFSIKVENGNTVYDSRDNCNAIVETATNTLIIGCKNTIIPNSVTSIGERAFSGCSSLTSVTIPNSVTSIGSGAFSGTAWYNNQPDGTVYAGKVLYIYKGAMPDGTKVKIKDGTLSIAESAFSGCSGLASVTIPNSVTSIGYSAFSGCSGLTSVTIPSSVTSIGYDVFGRCSGLTSIVSEIESPFVVHCFNDEIYTNATLTVPAGTKAAYQATEGWNKFANIVEEGATDEVVFSIDGVTYHGSSSDQTALVKSVDTSLPTVEIPASVSYEGVQYQVSGIDDNAFSGCTMAALVWNVDASLPSNAFSNASMGSNFLLYVKSGSYAPSSVKNVVVNGTAQSIVLSDDGGQFYCPQSFMAEKIFYTHNYSMETGGDGKGWETIALPFNVQKISHSTRGEIVPFASYNGGSNQKPFWLASMSSSGFSRSSSIQANQPYIIAMPNSNKYQNDYNLAGDVTFSAENVSVPATPTFSGTFLPAYSIVAKSASVYALNVKNRYVSYSGNYDAGSRFISSLRDVRPFEAYISESSTRGIIEIGSGDGTTGMPDVIGVYDADRLIDIYTLSGQKAAQSRQGDLDNVLNQLPHGVYIVNGKKIVK